VAGTAGAFAALPAPPAQRRKNHEWWRCVVLDLVVVLVTIVSFLIMWAVLRGVERM